MHEAKEEMRMLTVERRKVEATGLRVSDTAGAGAVRRYPEPEAQKVTSGIEVSSGSLLATVLSLGTKAP